jgi:PTS system nitrogen regulatory IIA component
MIKISKYLDPNQIVFLQGQSRDDVIQHLVNTVGKSGKINHPDAFFQAIIDREKIVTTGIGMGVAIPHAKLHLLSDFFIAIGVLKQGVDWKALDGTPVRLIFLIGGPDDKQTEYLQILSGLTLAIKDEERRKKILAATTPEEIIKLFKGF